MKSFLTAALALFSTVAFAAPSQDTFPPYRRRDFGLALFWTYQVAPGNIAQKGIAIPTLAPTQCYELKRSLRAPDGAVILRCLHGTILQLSEI